MPSMPYVNDCYHCAGGNQRMWVYKPWLDKLGLQNPRRSKSSATC